MLRSHRTTSSIGPPIMPSINHSTMQMTAKIVYYGPGLCGKTSNLQYIYDHTLGDSRGEMVSLETQTDRTLFFDLLPMEVGNVAGYQTRIQLYTVPGQVFYNSTRKLVLRNVDGLVFVADSQKSMLEANGESMDNLAENLAGLGLSIDEIPLVLQYNKRDLQGIATIEEMTESLDRHGWSVCEASAINGEGVFETLRIVSKVTLRALKKKLEAGQLPIRSSTVIAPSTAQLAALKNASKGLAESPADNHRTVVSRDVPIRMSRRDFERAKTMHVTLRIEDDAQETVEEISDLSFDLTSKSDDDSVFVNLKIDLTAGTPDR